MWHYHGSYGFKHPDPSYPYGVRVKRFPDWVPGGSIDEPIKGDDMVTVPMAWVLVNRQGRRFMNEQHPYMQDTSARPFEDMDPVTQSYPAVPAWLICDEDGRKLYPLGNPTYNDRDVQLDWSKDNSREIEQGIFKKADTIGDLATQIGIPQAVLEEDNCALECDGDERRGSGFRPPARRYGADIGAALLCRPDLACRFEYAGRAGARRQATDH